VAGCAPPTPPVPVGDRFVATTGADAGTCANPSAPCLTINYAVSQATSGQTVVVAAGTYPEMVTVDKPLVFRGANVGIPAGVTPGVRLPESVVKGFRSATSVNPDYPTADQEYDVSVDGFTIDPQGDAAWIGAPSDHRQLVSFFGGSHVDVRDNVFTGGAFVPDCGYTCTTMTASALLVQSGTFSISDNSFTNFQAPIDISQGLTASAHPVVSGSISSNTFAHVTNRAVWLNDLSGLGTFPGVSVSANTFDATGWTSPDWSPAGLVITTGGNTVDGNTFTAFGSGVFAQVCDGSNPSTAANTYTDNKFLANRTGINYYNAGAGCPANVPAVIKNNDFVANYGTGVKWNEFAPPGPNNLDATCNWWGDAAGPGANGANPVGNQVTFSPWNVASGGTCTGT